MTRRAGSLLIAALFLIVAATAVRAGCEPYPVTEHSPTGIVGCETYGQGTASMWGGPGIARNDCTYPWTDCQTLAIRSLDTGIVIIVTPSMYGDLYTTTPDERIVDLDPAAVAALGLDASRGLWAVEVHPVGSGKGGEPTPPLLPDTAGVWP